MTQDYAPEKYDGENIFARVLRGEVPATVIDEDAWALTIADINPQAPSHTLVLPKGSYADLTHFATHASDAELAGWVRAIVRVAEKQGLAESGYRVVVNCGHNAHQEVSHLHGHILGGTPLGPILGRSNQS